MKRKQYWPAGHGIAELGAVLEYRAVLAWDLLSRFGLVSGKVTGEDSAGRSVLDVMPAEEAVDRAFALADRFVDEVERRGEVREFTEVDVERVFRRGGELEMVRDQARWKRDEEERATRKRQRREEVAEEEKLAAAS